MKRCLLLAVWLLARAAAAQAPSAVPADFPATFSDLAALVDAEELDPLDMARGSLSASRYFAVGAPGVGRNAAWYRQARTFGQASVAGLYVTVWGQAADLEALRRELETNRSKRVWLHQMLGNEGQFFSSVESGRDWAHMLSLLPSVGGTRRLSVLCMESRDALVRRAGMFWGYFVADPAYWAKVKGLWQGDADPLNRRIATRLLVSRPG